ncbi:MAG TPA: hypothetical protein VFA99_03155, partial [Acidobacteriaceae bacterium]|nr:hypothetical protein [Acidobacteriaceae bacterium]
GFGAGSEQSLSNPMGNRGMDLHKWFMPTRTFHQMTNNSSPGSEGVDNSFAAKSFDNLGAWILGRNMFGPVRGPWPDDSWKGWWGDTPPYHVPVFVLTHYPRAPLTMNGGTTFHFVTDGIDSALAQARQAAAGKDIRIGGGGIDLPSLGYAISSRTEGEQATHLTLNKTEQKWPPPANYPGSKTLPVTC